MTMVVPRQGCHALALLNTQLTQHIGTAPRASGEVAIGHFVDIALDPPRYDLLGGVIALCVDQ